MYGVDYEFGQNVIFCALQVLPECVFEEQHLRCQPGFGALQGHSNGQDYNRDGEGKHVFSSTMSLLILFSLTTIKKILNPSKPMFRNQSKICKHWYLLNYFYKMLKKLQRLMLK
jgi:hypothetical protein